jgi:hypothetical protein
MPGSPCAFLCKTTVQGIATIGRNSSGRKKWPIFQNTEYQKAEYYTECTNLFFENKLQFCNLSFRPFDFRLYKILNAKKDQEVEVARNKRAQVVYFGLIDFCPLNFQKSFFFDQMSFDQS